MIDREYLQEAFAFGYPSPNVSDTGLFYRQPPIHQVVFYQSGIGTDNLYDEIVNGTQSCLANPAFYLTDRSACKGVTGANLGLY